MANKKLGYIPLYRTIKDHWIWSNDEPFSMGQAWIDLLLSVNHEDKKLKVGCNIITIHAGQMWTSYVKLGRNWNWSRTKVYRYIKMLKMDGMIEIFATPNGTSLTIVNYGRFAIHGNSDETTDETTSETTGKTSDETSDETQTRTIKNIKNYKKLNKKAAPAPPSDGGEWQ